MDHEEHLEQVRIEYSKKKLLRSEADPDPIKQFKQWFHDAMAAELPDLNVMQLSTIHEGKPSSRVVLLRSFDKDGFVFYTNYRSDKVQHIEQNPNVALCFFWWLLERQVRIEGTAERISAEQSDAYFNSRPRESKLGAWASHQSALIANREELDAQFKEVERRFEGKEVERPEDWGGIRVRPTLMEFWQGRESRLHDRLRYQLGEEGGFKIERLQP